MKLTLDLERANYWISQGAQPSDRVKQLIKTQKNVETKTQQEST